MEKNCNVSQLGSGFSHYSAFVALAFLAVLSRHCNKIGFSFVVYVKINNEIFFAFIVKNIAATNKYNPNFVLVSNIL